MVKKLHNISLLCQGSRGDFQPYLALAVELKEAGYNVRILTNIAYKKYAEEYNVDHVTIGEEDMEKLMNEDPDILESMANGDVSKMFDSISKQTLKHAKTDCIAFVEEMENNRPDILIIGTFGEYFKHYAQKILDIHTFEVALQSHVVTDHRAPLNIPVLPNKGHFNVLLKMLEGYYDGMMPLDDAMESMGRPKLTSVFSKESFLDLGKASLDGNPEEMKVICQSPLFKDILAPGSSEKLAFVGPCVLDSKQQEDSKSFFGGEESQKKLETFLAQDPSNKPVYCGWGSMLCKSPEFMVQFVVKALQVSGERGVVLGGFAGLSLDILKKQNRHDTELVAYAEKNVLFLDKASHESLFPLMKCIVHHGGAGTTNAAFRSGVPTIITPVFTDQFDHAYAVNKMGNGMGFSKQFQQISAEDLGNAISKVAQNPEMLRNAKEIQVKVLQENGKKVVVSMIEKYWNSVQSEE